MWPWEASSAPAPSIDAQTMQAFDKALADAAALRYEDAAKQFAALMPALEQSSDAQLASDCMFWMAFCYEKSSRKEQAVIFYQHLSMRYPGTKAADMAGDRLSGILIGAPPAPTQN